MRLWLTPVLILTLNLLPGANCAAAPGEKNPLQAQCQKCHKEVVAKANAREFIHPPFAEKKCLICHISSQGASPAAEVNPSQRPEKTKIRWLNISPALAAEHTFVFDYRTIGEKIFIEANSSGPARLRKELAVPPLSAMTKAVARHTPPRISDIRTSVRQNILIDAAITWRTDAKTNATVRYSIDGAEQIIEETNRFMQDHEMILPGLKNGATCRFTITCQDIFGNRATSPPLTFSTAEISPSSAAPTAHAGTANEEIALAGNFSAVTDESFMLELKTNQPVAITIGTSADETAERRPILEKLAQTIDQEERHVPLTKKKFSSMTVCATCHKAYNQQKSHPVNVLPRGKTKIPPEYPTLPDGRISCMSCHVMHAGDYEYRLIKSSRKELCSGCHPDKF